MAKLLCMQALRVLGLLLLAAEEAKRAEAHGTTLAPWGRRLESYYCPWCLGEKLPDQNPSGIINRNTVPSSPCLGSSRHGPTFGVNSFGTHKADALGPDAIYSPGQTFEARILLAADHQGEATWMLCPHTEEETEECFRDHQLMGWEDVHAWWGLDSTTRQSFSGDWFPQYVTLPSDLPYGNYTLRWFWVCKSTTEVFLSCIDIEVGDGGAAPVPTPPVVPTVAPAPTPLPAPGDADCAGNWENCRSSKCCQTAPHYQCYEKEVGGTYAQCRPSCPSDWSCAILSTDGTTTPVPTDYPTDAPATGPTSSPTATVSPVPSPTTAMPTMAPTSTPTATPTAATVSPVPAPITPMPSMAPTSAPTAATLSPVPAPTTAAPTMEPTAAPTAATVSPVPVPTPGSAPCAGSWQNCQASKCCQAPEQRCYEQNEWYAQCRPSCPGSGWSCVDLGSPTPAPVPTEAPTGAECVGTWSKCGGIGWSGPTACCGDGVTCEVVSDWYHQCKPSASLAQVGPRRHRGFLSSATAVDRASRTPALVQKESDLRQLSAAEVEEEEEKGWDARRAEL